MSICSLKEWSSMPILHRNAYYDSIVACWGEAQACSFTYQAKYTGAGLACNLNLRSGHGLFEVHQVHLC